MHFQFSEGGFNIRPEIERAMRAYIESPVQNPVRPLVKEVYHGLVRKTNGRPAIVHPDEMARYSLCKRMKSPSLKEFRRITSGEIGYRTKLEVMLDQTHDLLEEADNPQAVLEEIEQIDSLLAYLTLMINPNKTGEPYGGRLHNFTRILENPRANGLTRYNRILDSLFSAIILNSVEMNDITNNMSDGYQRKLFKVEAMCEFVSDTYELFFESYGVLMASEYYLAQLEEFHRIAQDRAYTRLYELTADTSLPIPHPLIVANLA